jgi:hypothetical protein
VRYRTAATLRFLFRGRSISHIIFNPASVGRDWQRGLDKEFAMSGNFEQPIELPDTTFELNPDTDHEVAWDTAPAAAEVPPLVEAVAVIDETPQQPVSVLEEVAVLATPVVEPVAEPVVIAEVPEKQYIAPIIEPAHRPFWPWAVGALSLAGLATALAWPHPTPVAQPAVVTPSAVAYVSAAPSVKPTLKPTLKPTTRPAPKHTPAAAVTPDPSAPVLSCAGGQLVVKGDTELHSLGGPSSEVIAVLPDGTPIMVPGVEDADSFPVVKGWIPVNATGADLPADSRGYIPVGSVACRVTVTG